MSYAKWLEIRQQEKQATEDGAVLTMAAVAEEELVEEPVVKADPCLLYTSRCV